MEITDYQFNGIPVFIYGLIGITTAILTYATVATDVFSSPDEEQYAEAQPIQQEYTEPPPDEPQYAEAKPIENVQQPQPQPQPVQNDYDQSGMGISTWNSRKPTHSRTYKFYGKGKHNNNNNNMKHFLSKTKTNKK